MFPVDSIPARYFEAREADDAAKRQAYLQKQQAALSAALAAKQATGGSLSSGYSTPSSSMVRPRAPETSGILGNIFNGLVRSLPNSAPGSGTSTPLPGTPLHTPSKQMTQAEIEALIAEKRKDIDKMSLPAWY